MIKFIKSLPKNLYYIRWVIANRTYIGYPLQVGEWENDSERVKIFFFNFTNENFKNIVVKIINEMLINMNLIYEKPKDYLELSDFDKKFFYKILEERFKSDDIYVRFKEIINKFWITSKYLPIYPDFDSESIERFSKSFLYGKELDPTSNLKFIANVVTEYLIITSKCLKDFTNNDDLEYFWEFYLQFSDDFVELFRGSTFRNKYVYQTFDEIVKIMEDIKKHSHMLESDKIKQIKIKIIYLKLKELNYLNELLKKLNVEIPTMPGRIMKLHFLYNLISGSILKENVYDKILEVLNLSEQDFEEKYTSIDEFYKGLLYDESNDLLQKEIKTNIFEILKKGFSSDTPKEVIHMYDLKKLKQMQRKIKVSGMTEKQIQIQMQKLQQKEQELTQKLDSARAQLALRNIEEQNTAAAGTKPPSKDKSKRKKKKKKGGNKKNTKKKSYKKR